jgi:hypothetical protein
MTAADEKTLSATDPRETGTQLRPGLWDTIKERYPGSMIRKENFVPPEAFQVVSAILRNLSPDLVLKVAVMTKSATFPKAIWRES